MLIEYRELIYNIIILDDKYIQVNLTQSVMLKYFQKKPRSSKKGGCFDQKCPEDYLNLDKI